MLEGREVEYFPRLEMVKIGGFPPSNWEDLTTENQFNEIYKVFGFHMNIKSVKFDH